MTRLEKTFIGVIGAIVLTLPAIWFINATSPERVAIVEVIASDYREDGTRSFTMPMPSQ